MGYIYIDEIINKLNRKYFGFNFTVMIFDNHFALQRASLVTEVLSEKLNSFPPEIIPTIRFWEVVDSHKKPMYLFIQLQFISDNDGVITLRIMVMPNGRIQTLEPNMKFPQHLFSHDEIVRYEGWEELKNCVINHLQIEIQ